MRQTKVERIKQKRLKVRKYWQTFAFSIVLLVLSLATINILVYFLVNPRFYDKDRKDSTVRTYFALDFFLLAVLFIHLDFPLVVVFFTLIITYYCIGILSKEELFKGFSNPGIMSAAFLFIIAAGIRETKILEALAKAAFLRIKNVTLFKLALYCSAAVASAFLTNTVLLVIWLPIVDDISGSRQISKHKILLPLSYSILLGSNISLVGNSMNVVAFSLSQVLKPSKDDHMGWNFFEIGYVGAPLAAIGIAYLMLFAPQILKDRRHKRRRLNSNAHALSPTQVVGSLHKNGYWVIFRVFEGRYFKGVSMDESGVTQVENTHLVGIIRGEEELATN